MKGIRADEKTLNSEGSNVLTKYGFLSRTPHQTECASNQETDAGNASYLLERFMRG
jgi:hypothetical protein